MKALIIAWKEIYENLSDRNLILIMIAAPLAIASIVGLAFGGLGEGGSPVEHIPVAILNEDVNPSTSVEYGGLLTELLVSGELSASLSPDLVACQDRHQVPAEEVTVAISLDQLIDGELFNLARMEQLAAEGVIELPGDGSDPHGELLRAARAAVDRGHYSALVRIPEGFATSVSGLATGSTDSAGVTVEVYANSGRRLAPGIVLSVVQSMVGQFAGGNIAAGAAMPALASAYPAALANVGEREMQRVLACAFIPGRNPIQLAVEPILESARSNAAGSILVAVGSAQAMFFALFTGQFGILSVYEERKNWTLQRLLASPTPRSAILAGKLAGVMGTILFQLGALVVALTAVGSLMAGELTMIWGSNLLILSALLLSVAIAVGGISMLMAGVLKSIEQANIMSGLVNIALAILGGAFGFDVPMPLASISMIYWGREAFLQLAAGRAEIGLHLAVLIGQGLLMFTLGLVLFNRRLDLGGSA